MENFEPDFSKILGKEFYLEPPAEVAKNLLGKILVKKINGKILAGIIVETEAYLSHGDESSHSYCGITARNAPMFEAGGTIYVYTIYGIHLCVNIVTEGLGTGSAVLLRAVEPISGIEQMKISRKTENIFSLCNGPAKLTQSFGFNIEDNFKTVFNRNLFVQESLNISENMIVTSKRIGISKSANLFLRFHINRSPFISIKNNSKYL